MMLGRQAFPSIYIYIFFFYKGIFFKKSVCQNSVFGKKTHTILYRGVCELAIFNSQALAHWRPGVLGVLGWGICCYEHPKIDWVGKAPVFSVVFAGETPRFTATDWGGWTYARFSWGNTYDLGTLRQIRSINLFLNSMILNLGGCFIFLKMFTPSWGRWTPFWRAYFSDGLVQPPTSSEWSQGWMVSLLLVTGFPWWLDRLWRKISLTLYIFDLMDMNHAIPKEFFKTCRVMLLLPLQAWICGAWICGFPWVRITLIYVFKADSSSGWDKSMHIHFFPYTLED